MNKQLYCKDCMCDRDASDFSNWYESDCKTARRCNRHVDSGAFNDMLENKKAMSEEVKAKLTPIQKNFCGTKYAEEKRNNKARIDELRDELAIKNEFDL